VVVAGAVNEPGLYPLTSGGSTALEVLALAGGPSRNAGNEVLLIRRTAPPPGAAASGAPEPRADRTVRIDLEELVNRGNLELNLAVMPGDIVAVPSEGRQSFYVLGYVARPGEHRLTPGSRVDAVQALAMGGGLAGIGRAGNCYLIRPMPDGQQTIPVDLTKMARGDSPPLYVQPGDTLVVGSTRWARTWEFVRPSMGVGANVTANASVVP
jgi:protein involved in polysaccharide export with SLBB domain